ncbi:LysR family transcriptional regulator, glycine cleavage system transcriptional activator [Yoonia tamlensis]|uniref:LysR family transcriptional regulator, glycine cleavage system transcriptional activator n=1 Tax=Yoonia tamlensis TaxID=390270 RepID=A0A1I6HH79_9RHOB|nr:LysR family transcriptional regulator [Yoonia tamlensis]SFR53660.1 LysR family transcriptional regulator, glycine cleavage system transcriptional activator [Yoonia tamlensis]
MSWRDVPSLAALRAFDAAARAGSFSQAARELNVTHAAIAQHVRAVEADLGMSLLVRQGRGVVLTENGARLADSLADGFGQIIAGVKAVRADVGSRPLSITATHNFAESWLMPRIGKFWAKHPEIALSIVPSNKLIDLRKDGYDVGIRYGDGNWPGLETTHLLAADYTVVAAPGVVDADKIAQSGATWFFEDTHQESQRWVRAAGLIGPTQKTVTVSTLGMALSAVRAGSGLTIAASALLSDDIRDGRLVALSQTRPAGLGYYIIHPPGVLPDRVKIFKKWLLAAL